MKKILYIHHGRGIGGALWSLIYLIEKLDKTKYTPVVLCLHRSSALSLLKERKIEVFCDERISSFSHTVLEWFSILSIPSFLKNIIKIPLSVYFTYKWVKKISPDIVHLNSSSLFSCAIGAKIAGTKVISHIREPLSRGYLGIRKEIISFLVDKFSDAIIAISNYDARQLGNSKKVRVIYNFVDFSFFDWHISGGKFRKEFLLDENVKTVGMLGGVSPLRGTLEFIKAAALASKSVNNVCFFVIGWRPEKEISFFKQPRLYFYWKKIQKVVREASLRDRIFFTGVRKNMPEVIAGLDLIVFPSLIPQFARPLIEAGAMKKPVIASNLGGQNEIVVQDRTGKLVPSGDYKKLAQAIVEILGDEKKAQFFAENGFERARKIFNADINAKKTFEVYEEILKREKLLIYDPSLLIDKTGFTEIYSTEMFKRSFLKRIKLLRKKFYDEIAVIFYDLKYQKYLLFWETILVFLKSKRKYLKDTKGRIKKVFFLKTVGDFFLNFSQDFFHSTVAIVRTGVFVKFFLKKVCKKHFQTKRTLKKIVYLKTDFWFGLKTGGSVSHTAGVVKGFVKNGIEVLFFSTEKFDFENTNVRQFSILPKKFISNIPETGEMLFNFEFLSNNFEFIKGEKPDLIYQRYSLNNFCGVILSKKLKCPFVLEYNGSMKWIAKNWGKPLFFENIAEKIEMLNLKFADLIVVVSEVLKQELINRGIDEKKILVNPNGFDTEICNPAIDGSRIKKRYNLEGKTVVGFIGTFGPWHGAEILAKAVKRVVEKNSSIKFMFVGDGVKMEEVKRIVKKDDVEDFVIFAGLVPQKSLPEYLACCDILVSPHVPNPDGSKFFGSPTKLFEYMAMGKAIVASNLEQIGEVLEHKKTAWLVKPGNIKELTEGIIILARDKELRNMLGRNAGEVAMEKYAWDKHVLRTIEKLEKGEKNLT